MLPWLLSIWGWMFMSNITASFQKNKKSLIVFLTAGDPSLEKTIEYILTAETAGADLIEIGIPFSDPVAEGVVIQRANERALSKNIKIDEIFEMVKILRKQTNIPLVFLTYINPIFKYGSAKFTKTCKEIGIDGLIIPDVPYEEKGEISSLCVENHLELISLVAPTSNQRIAKIAKEATGFVYCVSSLGVTGMRSHIQTNLRELTAEIKKNTDVPVAIGFGISNKEQVAELKAFADGLIVGSAVVKIIEEHGENAKEALFTFIKGLKDAMK